MRKLLIALLILLIPASSHAIDKKIGATNQFKYGVFDISSKANGGAGLTYNTHYVLKVQCGTGATVTIDGTGDTITDESSGYYRATTNDTISPTNEDPCLYWTEGAGIYAGMVAKMPFPFKASNNTSDGIIATGTENGVASATRIYWSGAINQRTHVNMCMAATIGSNIERSKITGYGSGYNDVRGFSAAPTDSSTINIYTDGCN